MASSEAEWVTIANSLLFKCHIHLRIHELRDCDASVFIALYQSILGEKVPDLIVIARNQEDDAHNVQAVIDSLALDYLQVSLSHITGENIVKGDKGSIKNLLEIFDGLLEYLTEHISESSHNKSASEQFCKDSCGEEPVEELQSARESSWRKVPLMRRSFSSDVLGPTWDEEETESTGEIIRLGDTAHTFSLRSNGAQNSMDFWSRKPPPSGIRSPEEVLNPGSSSFLSKNGPTCEEAEAPLTSMAPSARKLGEPIRAAIPLHPPYHPSEPRAPCPIGKEYLWSSHHHTAPSVEPDDVFLTSALCKDDDQETCLDLTESSKTRKLSKGERSENRAVTPSEYPPFPQKARMRLTGQELHAMSEKLSQRLSELDWMLKTALGDRATNKADGKDGGAGDEEAHSGHEEMLSQHSDSVMECGPRKPRPGFLMHRKAPYRSHSLSPSSVNKHRQLEKERKKQHRSKGTDTRHFQAKELTEAFERELRKNKVQENVGLRGIREAEEEETVGKSLHLW